MQRPASDCVADLLQVGQAEQLDVVHAETTVGYRRGNRVELQRLCGLVQLQEEVGVTFLVGTRDKIETRAVPRAGKIREQSEAAQDGVVGWHLPDRRDARFR